MNITISPAATSDASLIRSLGLNTKELQVENEGGYYYEEEILQAFFESPHDVALVAKVDDIFAGYFITTYNPYLKEAYLIDLAVKPEYRKLGVASALIEKMFQSLDEKHCRWVWCLVHEDNERIQEILKKEGMKKGRKFTFFYKEAPISNS